MLFPHLSSRDRSLTIKSVTDWVEVCYVLWRDPTYDDIRPENAEENMRKRCLEEYQELYDFVFDMIHKYGE